MVCSKKEMGNLNLKRNDWILIGILLLAGVSFLVYNIAFGKEGVKVRVMVNQEEFGVYNLNEEQIININNHDTLLIKDGYADMIEADCPDKLCVKQNPISKSGESIICLPNKVVINIIGKQKADVDAVVN